MIYNDDPNDEITCYFVIKDDEHQHIKAWSTNKQLAKFYMEFHNNKMYKLKKVESRADNIQSIIEDNLHDEITLSRLTTKERDKDGNLKTITIPATVMEMNTLNDERQSFFSGHVSYSYINEAVGFLKPKYGKALSTLLLDSVIKMAVYNINDGIASEIKFDELMILYLLFPNEFQ
jgi:hypothetical protein